MTFELRDYQKEAIDGLYNYWAGKAGDNPLIVAPTGSGKTAIIAQLIKDAMGFQGTRVLVVTHVKEQQVSKNIDHDTTSQATKSLRTEVRENQGMMQQASAHSLAPTAHSNPIAGALDFKKVHEIRARIARVGWAMGELRSRQHARRSSPPPPFAHTRTQEHTHSHTRTHTHTHSLKQCNVLTGSRLS